MANKFDVILGEYRQYDGVAVSDTAPSGQNGYFYINSVSNTLNIYWAGTWQVLHTLSAPTSGTIVAGNPIGLLLSITYS